MSQQQEAGPASEINLHLIVDCYRKEMQLKMNANTLTDWPMYHDQIIQQNLNGDLLQNSCLNVENSQIVKDELAKEFEHLKTIQISTLGSIDRTINCLGEKQRKKFYAEFEKYLTQDNLGAMKELAVAVSNSMMHVELKRLEKSVGKKVQFFKTLMEQEMTSCLHSVDLLIKAVQIFQGIMHNEINSAAYKCFSTSEFQYLVNKTLNMITNQFLGEITAKPQFFTNILKKFVAVDFEKRNKEIQSTERQIHSNQLESYYQTEMHNFLVKCFRTETDIKDFHHALIASIKNELQTTGMSRKLELEPEGLVSKLNTELEKICLRNDERNREDASRNAKMIVARLENEFSSDFSQEISGRVLTEDEYGISYEKLRNKYLLKLSNEIKEAVTPKEEIISEYKELLQKLLDGHLTNLKVQNGLKTLSPHNEAISAPIVAVNFQINFTQVGIVQENGNFQKVPFGNDYSFTNGITFLKNKYLVGSKGHPEKIEEVTIRDVTENIKYRMPGNLNCKNINGKQLSIDLKLLLSLIFTHVKESCEKFKTAMYETVVIAVPIWFGSVFRQDIKDAAIISGFKQIFLLNDTSAVALQFFKSHNNQTDQPDEKQNQLVIVTADADKCCSAVYTLNKNSTISMTANLGDCHLSNWIHKWKYQPSHVSVIQEILAGRKYANAIVLCKIEKIAKECVKVLEDDIKGNIQVEDDTAVLQGVGYFALLLTQNVPSAVEMLQDKTFYDLSIETEYLKNKIVINRLTSCQPHGKDVLSFEMRHKFKGYYDSLRIYEHGYELLKTRFPVKILRGKPNEEMELKFFVNGESIYSVGSKRSCLDRRDSRDEIIRSYRLIINDNFVSEKELDVAKKELRQTATCILKNIEKVSNALRNDAEKDANNAIQMLQQCNEENLREDAIANFLKRLTIVKMEIEKHQRKY